MSIPDSIANGTNPTHLPSRYEIRQLGPLHIPWASAIVVHSNIFYSPIWPNLYPVDKTQRAYNGQHAADYLVRHQIESGLSFGVFDREYKYKNPALKYPGGELLWDFADKDASAETLLSQMDFPLASIALAYDMVNPLDPSGLGPLMAVLPSFGTVYHVLDARDPRPKESWIAQAPTEVLLRNATSTRREYEGEKLMSRLARWLMREAALKGFRGAQIECGHDAVTHTWLHPPKPFAAELVSEFNTREIETEGADGRKAKEFGDVEARCTKVYVTL